MEYISHEDFKNLMGKFQKETPKSTLKEAVEEGNAFTAALAKTKKGQKTKVGGKEITDTSGYDDPSVKEYGYNDQYPGAWPFREEEMKESDITIDQWYDNFQDGLDNLLSNRYISKLEHGYYMKALDHVDPMDKYSEMNGYDAAKAFVDDLRTKSQMDADEEQWSREMGEGRVVENVKVIDTLSDRKYKIKRPDGQVVDVYFDDVHVEEMVDPPYGASGWISGQDDDGNEYVMFADLVDMGGGDWDIEADHSTIEFNSATSNNEGLHMPPLQATGPTIDVVENSISNPPFGFSVLSPDERKQLEEYITSIKTIKKEIVKLTAKAGKKVKEGDLGGNRTDLVMTPSVTSEADSHDKIEKIEKKIPENIYKASVAVIKHLRKAGLNDGEIMMFLKHEMEEEAQKAIMGQHDF